MVALSRQRLCFLRIIPCTVLAACGVFFPSLAGCGEIPNAQEIAQRLREQYAKIRNVHSVTLWETSHDGKPTSWQKVTVDSVERQRIKYFEQRGDYDAQGNRTQRTTCCTIWDGNIIAGFDYNYDFWKGAGQGTSTHVDVFDGSQPGEIGPFSRQNPVGYLTALIIIHLDTCVREDVDVAISRLPSSHDTLYELKYRMGTENDGHYYRAVVHWERGVAVSADLRDSESKLLRDWTATKYEEFAPGVWVPREGRKRMLQDIVSVIRGKDGKPLEVTTKAFDIRFRCSELQLNHSDFSEDVFDITLNPGTYVYDLRYRVDYQIGNQPVPASEIVRTSLDALDRQRKRSR